MPGRCLQGEEGAVDGVRGADPRDEFGESMQQICRDGRQAGPEVRPSPPFLVPALLPPSQPQPQPPVAANLVATLRDRRPPRQRGGRDLGARDGDRDASCDVSPVPPTSREGRGVLPRGPRLPGRRPPPPPRVRRDERVPSAPWRPSREARRRIRAAAPPVRRRR